jgi:hypothetical protein
MSRGIDQGRRRFLATSLITLAAAPLGMLACSAEQSGTATAAAPTTNKDESAMLLTAPRHDRLAD